MIQPRSIRMRRANLCFLSIAMSLGFVSPCHAQSVVQEQDTGGNAPRAVITTCVACHGALGEGTASGNPRLAGQDADYLAHALEMFKADKRASSVMQAVAHNLSDNDIHNLAAFFAQQNPPLATGAAQAPQTRVRAGKQLAEMGMAPDIPACFTCHATGGKGNGARFPAIAGEPAAFVVARLHEFQARAKKKTPAPGTMTAVSAMLNDTQIEDVADYLSIVKP